MLPGYVLLLLTASPFNLCLICVIARSRHIRTVTNVLVASLATSDFMLAVFVVPPEMMHYLWQGFRPIGIGCVFHQSVQVFIPLVSITHLLAISIERYIKICHPLKYSMASEKTCVICALAIIWILPLLVAALPAFGWNNLGHINGTDYTNLIANKTSCVYLETMPCSYMGIIFLIILLTLLTMSTLYIRVLSIASYHAQRIAATSIIRTRDTLFRAEMKAVIILVVTVGFFFLSWIPFAIVVTYECISQDPDFNKTWWQACIFIAYLNSSINPLIYGIGNREIRRILQRMFRCRGIHKIYPDTISSAVYLKTINATMNGQTTISKPEVIEAKFET